MSPSESRSPMLMMALEPRWMFDGAAVADAVHVAVESGHADDTAKAPAAVEPPARAAERKEVAFIDSSVAGWQQLAAGLGSDVEVVVLDGARDGLAQIAQWADSHSGYDAVHLFSHGGDGQVTVGTFTLSDESLTARRSDLSALGRSLSADGDLLLYGCDVARSDSGLAFIRDLSLATGADVAASADTTGTAARGGDWVLERTIGSVGTAAFAVTDWDGVLFSSSDTTGATSNVAGTIDSSSDPANSERTGTYWDTYYLTGVNDGDTVQIYIDNGTLSDPYVQVLNIVGYESASDDDAGSGLDAYVSYTYHTGDGIGATTYSSGATGSYTIYVSAGTLNAWDPPVYISAKVTVTLTDTSATDTFSTSTGTVTAHSYGNVDTDATKTFGATNASGTGGTVSGGVSTVAGTYGSLAVDTTSGAYTFTPDATAVNAASSTTSETFWVTVRNSHITVRQAFTVTVNGVAENVAPVAVADSATAVEAGGVANATAGTNPTGNVLTNDTDADAGDTKTVSAISGGTVGQARAGTYGSLTLNSDGSYTYTVDNTNSAVQELRTTAQTLTDSFTYTMSDTAGLTSSSTLTVTLQGGNDNPVEAVAQTSVSEQHQVGWTWGMTVPSGTFTDVDGAANGETLAYSAALSSGASLPGWMTFDASTRTFSGTPPVGTYALTLRLTGTDAAGATATTDFTANFTITAPPKNDAAPPPGPPGDAPKPPVTAEISQPVIGKAEGGTPIINSLRGEGSDAKAAGMQTVVRETSAAKADSALTLTSTVANASAAPAAAPAFTPTPTLSAPSDGGFRVAVVGGGTAVSGGETVVVARPIGEVVQTGRVSFAIPVDSFAVTRADAQVSLTATRADGQPLPAWLVFNPATGRFEGTPPPGETGTVEIKVSAKDASGAEAAQVFRIQVRGQGADAGRDPAQARHAFQGKAGLGDQLKAARSGPERFATLARQGSSARVA